MIRSVLILTLSLFISGCGGYEPINIDVNASKLIPKVAAFQYLKNLKSIRADVRDKIYLDHVKKSYDWGGGLTKSLNM